MWIFLSGAMRFISNLWSRRGKNLVGPKWLCWYEYHKPKVVKPSNPRQKSMAKPQTWPQAQSYLVLVTLLSLNLFFLPILPTLNQPLSQSHSHTFRLRFWTLTWNFLWSVKKNMNLFIANINLDKDKRIKRRNERGPSDMDSWWPTVSWVSGTTESLDWRNM